MEVPPGAVAVCVAVGEGVLVVPSDVAEGIGVLGAAVGVAEVAVGEAVAVLVGVGSPQKAAMKLMSWQFCPEPAPVLVTVTVPVPIPETK